MFFCCCNQRWLVRSMRPQQFGEQLSARVLVSVIDQSDYDTFGAPAGPKKLPRRAPKTDGVPCRDRTTRSRDAVHLLLVASHLFGQTRNSGIGFWPRRVLALIAGNLVIHFLPVGLIFRGARPRRHILRRTAGPC